MLEGMALQGSGSFRDVVCYGTASSQSSVQSSRPWCPWWCASGRKAVLEEEEITLILRERLRLRTELAP